MKNYTKEPFIDRLKSVNFPNYENFQDADYAYSDFLNKLTSIINDIAPTKKFKKSKLHVDEIQFKEARNVVVNLIKRKKIYIHQK